MSARSSRLLPRAHGAIAVRVSVAPLLLLTACSANDEAEPEQPPPAPRLGIASCAYANDTQIPVDSRHGYSLAATGTVLEVASRQREIASFDLCPRSGRLMLGQSYTARFGDDTTWLRLQPLQGPEIILSVTAPGFAPQLRPGDVIQVDAQAY